MTVLEHECNRLKKNRSISYSEYEKKRTVKSRFPRSHEVARREKKSIKTRLNVFLFLESLKIKRQVINRIDHAGIERLTIVVESRMRRTIITISIGAYDSNINASTQPYACARNLHTLVRYTTLQKFLLAFLALVTVGHRWKGKKFDSDRAEDKVCGTKNVFRG